MDGRILLALLAFSFKFLEVSFSSPFGCHQDSRSL